LFGFLTPREITTTTATVLPQIETAVGPDRGVFQLLPNPESVDWILGKRSGSGEYFLVENRQRTGDFDVALPGDGVLIWHVYESAFSFNSMANSDEGTTPPGNPRLVVLEQADGRFDIECYANPPNSSRCNPGDGDDPWKNGTATAFNDASTPNSKRYDQSATGVSITNISDTGPVMSAILHVPSSPAISHSQPSLQPDGVVNGASFRSPSNPGGTLAPGTIVAIFGTGLADFSTPAFSGPLPTTMGDTSVLFNGVPVPLLYVSSTQINAQLPFDFPLGAVTVQVRRGTVTTAAQSVRIGPVSPGIFSVRTQTPAAEAILLADHSGPVTDESPATPGSFVSIYCTGLGALRQGVSAGIISPNPSPETINRPLVNIANVPAPVTYSGLAPGLVGIYRVDVQIPMGVTAGDHPVQMFINGVFSNAVTIPISHTSSLTPRKVRATKFLGEVSMQDAQRSLITNPCCR
jgi:uncharacterized protein (TIGR03437 family)